MSNKTIPIAEIFGPTLQGEGALAGLPTYFIRVGGCDYSCRWCDSDHAVLPEHVRSLTRFTQGEISLALTVMADDAPGPDWVTISGGNPGLYDLGEVVHTWQYQWQYQSPQSDSGLTRKVAVETQGSRWQPWFADVNLLTVSPKPPSSGMSDAPLDRFMEAVGDAEETNRARDRAWPYGDWQMVFKVVVFDEADYLFAQALHQQYPLIKFYLSCGTAMGGLSGKWVPPAIPDLAGGDDYDRYFNQREHPELDWVPHSYVDPPWYLLRRYRWLADRVKGDPAMADVATLVQLHCLLYGIETRGV